VKEPNHSPSIADKWAEVDAFLAERLAPHDAALAATQKNTLKAGLPSIMVTALQGKFLALLVMISNARRVLEIGTLGGYSSLWMARALPEGGSITTIELDPRRARLAQENLRQAGYADKVEVLTGTALDILPGLEGPFDLIFIDADKPNNPAYLEWALKLSRPGTVIVVDNVVRDGTITEQDPDNRTVTGIRKMLDMMSASDRLESTALQTVGEKGWDGFTISIVK